MAGVDAQTLRGAYAGKRVLVTGHTGFKGSWLTLWLASLEAEVTGLALPPSTEPSLFEAAGVGAACRHVLGDVRDPEAVRRAVHEARPDAIFHLAAQPLVRLSYEQPVETFATNVMGTAHLLDAIRLERQRCAVVVVTSDKCYANREWEFGYREVDALGGHDP
jgi:CDP-glucose 4,6-dehydratase